MLHDVRVAKRQRPRRMQLDGELDPGVVVRRDLGPVDVVEREHPVGVVGVDLQRQGVDAMAKPPRDVERVSREVTLHGEVRRDPLAVEPYVGLAHDAVNDQLAMLRGTKMRREGGAEPPGHREALDGVLADSVHVPEAALHVGGEEDVRAMARLDERVDLGADSASTVRVDMEPRTSGEARLRNSLAGLRGRSGALDLPAVQA